MGRAGRLHHCECPAICAKVLSIAEDGTTIRGDFLTDNTYRKHQRPNLVARYSHDTGRHMSSQPPTGRGILTARHRVAPSDSLPAGMTWL